ncbi:unnamed protein product [Adineta steineri]|uniref:Uncharacterized protein n=1 Tax=Adineta steineri TaxID=433720 RepID=A0A814NGW5_9BILA|nr:unnamed protein product [Adineta steineri]
MSDRSLKNLFVDARVNLVGIIRDLNLFSNNPFWSSILNYSEKILSTRLFLLFLSVSLLIVTIYASLIVQTHSITLRQFSLSDFEYLQTRYSTTINVPCTHVSNPYHKFIQLSPKFHQICSSPFVDDKWISSLFLFNATSHNILDFRTFTFAQFQSLALLCHTAYQAVYDGYRTFNSTHLITNYLLSRIEFNEIANVLINHLQDYLVANENRTVRVVLMSIAQNRLMSALRTNFYIESEVLSGVSVVHNGIYLTKNETFSGECDCRLEGNQCTYPAGAFYNWTLPELDKPAKSYPPPRYKIPGLMAGCLPLESIRQSTLECLYKQSCINILSIQPNISRPKPLKISLSKFPLNLTIGSIFDKFLFIESWKNTISYEQYFTACSPRSLTYSYSGRLRFATIFTICVSAFGGLVIIWQLITPAIMKIWHLIKGKKQEKQLSIPQEQQLGIEQIILKISPKPINKVTSHVHRTIYTFNLFCSDDENDFEEQYVGIISTRFYILFLLIGFIILSFYTSLMKRTQTYTIDYPTLIEFNQLQSLYSSTLICSCSRFSMSYNRIMSISPRYHQICSSEFLEKTWLSYFDLKEINSSTTLFTGVDFRISGQSFFSLLRDLCKLSKETVNNAIRLFRSRRLVTLNTFSEIQFHDETKIRLKLFQQQTIASFVNLIQLIRSSIQTNRLITDLLNDAGFSPNFNNKTSKWSPIFYYRNIDNSSCSCAYSSQCIRSQGFYLQSDDRDSNPKIIIPGLVLGCYTIDSLLFSNLQCLYQQKCIQLLIDMYYFDAVGLFHPLNNRTAHIQSLEKNKTRFTPNTTIESIVSQLFVEDWRTSKNFSAYYRRCAPKQCTYNIIRRFHMTYMITIMLGFYSGLSVILEIILPHLVRFIRQQWKKRQHNIDSSQTATTTDNLVLPNVKTKNSCLFWKIYRFLRLLNLFSNKSSSTVKEIKRNEIIATRIYIFLFLLSLIVALLYAGPFNDETKTVIIKFPTSNIVNNLYSKNISTLSCPCSTAAVRYSKFLTIIPEYRRICSSDYVKSSYYINLFKQKDRISRRLSAHYRILATFCQQSQRIIKSAQDVFADHELISVETVTYSSFIIQSEALVSKFISQIPADYRRTLTFIMRSFEVNHFLNVFTSNWKLEYTDDEQNHIITTYPNRFSSSNCTCATSFNCTDPITEDIVTGCFPFDGFRLSKFSNLSLGQLNDELFVMTWKNVSNYTAYFHTCHPFECQYTLPNRNDPLTMLTTILGLYAGLIYSLRLIVGQSLRVYQWWLKNRPQSRQQQQQQEQQIERTCIDSMTI